MAIDKIVIDNFQSHKHTELDLSRGINVIVGQSDTGKTAILRALKWVFFNRPLGDFFRSSWGGDTEVSVNLNEGTLSRWKGERSQGYSINGKKLTAIKTEVPQEVQDFLNISDVNIQSQFDRPFLIDSSAGEVGQYFNKIAHLEVIDSAIYALQASKNQLSSKIKHLDDDELKLNNSLVSYEGLGELEACVEDLEFYSSKRDNFVLKRDNIVACVSKIEQMAEKIKTLEPVLALEGLVLKIENLSEEKKALQSQIDCLAQIIEKLDDIKFQEPIINAILSKASIIEGIVLKVDEERRIAGQASLIKMCLSSIEQVEKTLERNKSDIEFYASEFSSKMPKICPLCGMEVGACDDSSD